MAVTLTYDAVLSRVRIAGVSYLNANPYFEIDVTNWTVTGGTFVRSTAQFHEGAASGLLTPDGVSALVFARCEVVPATVGGTYRARAWVRCAVARSVNISINWRDGGGVLLSTSTAAVAVAATTWTFLEVAAVAPASTTQAQMNVSMGTTPPAGHTLHVDEATLETDPVTVQRSTDQIRWTTVRGGADLPSGVVALDDYEFADGVANFYRVSGQTADDITPALTKVWLKSIARPFLNREVTVRGFSPIIRRSRSGVFPIVGRSLPVAVTDLQGSKEWTLDVTAVSPEEADALDLLISTGEVQFIHVPSTGRLSTTPRGYVALGDTTEELMPTVDLRMRVFSLPLTAVSAPGPDVIPAVGVWSTVINTYVDWNGVIAAHADWNDLLQLVGSTADVIVP